MTELHDMEVQTDPMLAPLGLPEQGVVAHPLIVSEVQTEPMVADPRAPLFDFGVQTDPVADRLEAIVPAIGTAVGAALQPMVAEMRGFTQQIGGILDAFMAESRRGREQSLSVTDPFGIRRNRLYEGHRNLGSPPTPATSPPRGPVRNAARDEYDPAVNYSIAPTDPRVPRR